MSGTSCGKESLYERRDEGVHQGLISQFALHLVKTGEVEEEYGDILRQIKEDRETGDYEPLVTFGSEEATQLVGSAGRFLARIRDWIGKKAP